MAESKKKGPLYAVGTKFKIGADSYLKVMAEAEGYYMVRYKGAMPFCLSGKELQKRIETIQNDKVLRNS